MGNRKIKNHNIGFVYRNTEIDELGDWITHKHRYNEYSKLIVTDYCGVDSERQKHHLCKAKCDCGNEFITRFERIRNGSILSCGCTKKKSSAYNFCEALSKIYTNHKFKFANKTSDEFYLSCINNNGILQKFHYDLVIDNKIIIELHGKQFHPKSVDDKEWQENYCRSYKVDAETVKHINEVQYTNQEIKRRLAENSGYVFLDLWYDSYNQDYCINLIGEYISKYC